MSVLIRSVQLAVLWWHIFHQFSKVSYYRCKNVCKTKVAETGCKEVQLDVIKYNVLVECILYIYDDTLWICNHQLIIIMKSSTKIEWRYYFSIFITNSTLSENSWIRHKTYIFSWTFVAFIREILIIQWTPVFKKRKK